MKTLNGLLSLCGIWLFIACSASVPKNTTMNFTVIYDTQPRGAVVYCGGKEMGLSPYIRQNLIMKRYKKSKQTKANTHKWTARRCGRVDIVRISTDKGI